jgi:formate dehydrogenase subunit gamma
MAILLRHIRLIVGALVLACMAVAAAPAGAQHINPTAESVKEEQLLKEAKRISGECTLPDRKACTLEQPRGQDWRYWYQVPLRLVGGLAILGMIGVVIAFYLYRGPVKIAHGRSGRVMVRFHAFERFMHWLATACFIILALSGLNLTFGKALLLPAIGPEAFAAISRLGKYAHNYLSFPFTLSVIVIFLMWVRWNLPTRLYLQWIKEGGGFGEKHPPADLFHVGQKSIFWVVVLGSAVVAATGYVLMFPFLVTGIVGMQLAQLVHALVALLYVAAMVFHIYMGTVGEEGAFEGMWDGTVDEEWSKQHHSVWYEREVGKGNIPRVPAEGGLQPAAKPSTDDRLQPAG